MAAIIEFKKNKLFTKKETSTFVGNINSWRNNFEVEFLEEAKEFLKDIPEKARSKIIYNLTKAKVVNDSELFKKLNDTVWEFRTLYNKTSYRLFAFWDRTEKTETLVVSTHGIEKKTQKTPKKEIEKTERLRRLYFETKK